MPENTRARPLKVSVFNHNHVLYGDVEEADQDAKDSWKGVGTGEPGEGDGVGGALFVFLRVGCVLDASSSIRAFLYKVLVRLPFVFTSEERLEECAGAAEQDRTPEFDVLASPRP